MSDAIRGGAVKALGDGKISGYLVLFTTPNDPDLEGDFFTKETDFMLDPGDVRPIIYRHGFHPVLKSRRLGKATLTIDEIGLFLEGELNLRDNYEKAIYILAEKGKLGFSSGALAHLAQKKEMGNGVKEVLCWPIGEASLTPSPVESRTSVITFKSLEEPDDDLTEAIKGLEPAADVEEESISIEGLPALRAFCMDVAPTSQKKASQRSESAAYATKEFLAVTQVLGEAYDAYTARLVKRAEHRFVKESRTIDATTVEHVKKSLDDIGKVELALAGVKEKLSNINRIVAMSQAEERALYERARLAVLNFCEISGTPPEELR